MSKLSEINHLLSEIQKSTQWFRSNANISKALSASEGAVDFRQGVIGGLHDLCETIDQLLLFWKQEKSVENPELVELGRQTKDEITKYEQDLLDSQVNAARAFHKAYSQLHSALLRVDTFTRFITNLIRIQKSPKLPEDRVSAFPSSSPSTNSSERLPTTSLFTSEIDDPPKPSFELPASPLGRLLEENQDRPMNSVSTFPPGRLAPRSIGKEDEDRIEKLHGLFPFDKSVSDRSTSTEISRNEDISKNPPLISGHEIIHEVKQIKLQVAALQKQKAQLESQVSNVSTQEMHDPTFESDLVKIKSTVSRLQNHIRVLEEQNQKLGNQILQYQEIMAQFRSKKDPNFHNVLKENLSLVNQLTQIRRQRIEIRFEELENELSELRKILKK